MPSWLHFNRHVMNRKFGVLVVVNISLCTAFLLYEVLSHKPGQSALYRRPESSGTLVSHALRQAREVGACSTPLFSWSSYAGICTRQQQLVTGYCSQTPNSNAWLAAGARPASECTGYWPAHSSKAEAR